MPVNMFSVERTCIFDKVIQHIKQGFSEVMKKRKTCFKHNTGPIS